MEGWPQNSQCVRRGQERRATQQLVPHSETNLPADAQRSQHARRDPSGSLSPQCGTASIAGRLSACPRTDRLSHRQHGPPISARGRSFPRFARQAGVVARTQPARKFLCGFTARAFGDPATRPRQTARRSPSRGAGRTAPPHSLRAASAGQPLAARALLHRPGSPCQYVSQPR